MAEEFTPPPEEFVAIISGLKDRAEVAARAAEEASAKANSESGFAFNAKQNAEEHAKAISIVRGTVDADYAWLTTTKKNSEELAQSIASAKAASDTDSRQIAEAKASRERDSASAKAANERIAALLNSAETTQSKIADTLKTATAEMANLNVAKANADAAKNAIENMQAQTSDTASKVNIDAELVKKAEAESKALFASMSETVEMAKETHQRVEKYQEKLRQLQVASEELHSKIESLLPNATSAGLASAFKNQKDRFSKPQKYWLFTFVLAIALLLLCGMYGLPGTPWSGNNTVGQESWDAILRHIISRLPLVAPLVWLAIYAGRHYTLALRVEEEYAFKEAVSTAFEGYKREMAGISSQSDGSLQPIVTLCENVLRALAQRPGRIYEGRHEDITPFTPLAKAIGDTATSLVGSTKKDG